jgi:hypothetical protein
MYDMEDEPVAEPLETIHLYVVREGQERPSLLPILISIVALSLLIAIGVLVPYQQPEQRASIRVPAVLLPLKTFTTEVSVIPTGVKTYQATQAHGVVTIYNGSILAQELPHGMVFSGKDGVEVATDEGVVVPAGNPPAYGIATVSVHAVMPGSKGNIAALDINQVYGTSLYIRNLQPFSSGADSYTVRFITAQDRQNALSQARMTLLRQTFSGLLYYPCLEQVTGTTSLHIVWTCQFVTYTAPSLPHVRVLQVQVIGRTVLVTIAYIPRPHHLDTK